jgi:CRISPR-associated protein Cas2
MTVLILTACPPGLRGHVTRWLLEIAPGVYVGRVTARVRDHLWERVSHYLGESGKALLVHTTRGEQGLTFRSLGHNWQPEDHDGVMLIRRPAR